jgi:cytochrome b
LPLRIFHWSLVIAVSTAIVTAEIGGDWMEWHGRAGLTIVGLLVFRLAWGIVGTTHARFFSFAPSPRKIHNYLKGRWQGVGHNPLGALAVFGLLGLLMTQAATGLFANDDIAFTGPLFSLVGEAWSGRLTAWHRQLSDVLFVLIGLHVAAIVFYAIVKRNNLVKPMVTGWKELHSADAPEPTRGGGFPALIISVAVALIAVYGASNAAREESPPAPSAKQAPTW